MIKEQHLFDVEKKMKAADALILPGNKFDLNPQMYSEKKSSPEYFTL